jgi:hypothetical protein
MPRRPRQVGHRTARTHHARMTTPTASRRAKSAPARSQRRPPGRGGLHPRARWRAVPGRPRPGAAGRGRARPGAAGGVGGVGGNVPRGVLLARLGRRLVGAGLVAAGDGGAAPGAAAPAAVPLPVPLVPPATMTVPPRKSSRGGAARFFPGTTALAGAMLKGGSVAGGRRGAHVSGGLSYRRPLVVVVVGASHLRYCAASCR